MNKACTTILFLILTVSLSGQLNNEAWENYEKSVYEDVNDSQHQSDVTIIFDRLYYTTISHKESMELLTTVHRKIKINSLYGLEQFNKLYIPTLNEFDRKLEFVDCKAKTLKKGKPAVITDTSTFVTTTLPANAPTFYKMKGNVKMLALNDINIGDEIEYVYSIKFFFNYAPENYYRTERILFKDDHFCLERSVYFDAQGFNVRIWPYNFPDGRDRNADFSYKTGKKVGLSRLEAAPDELYSITSLNEPFIYYIIDNSMVVKEDTWEDFAQNFKPHRSETKKNSIFNGEKLVETLRDIGKISGIKNKYQAILEKINKPIEDHFDLYHEVRNDVDVAWSYAKIISKTVKSLNLPIDFHFVVSKHRDVIDKTYVSLYQFDNIITSFQDEEGTTYYMPLLEPYSSFNDVRSEFQGTECFTISQDATGKRSFSFNKIPDFNNESFYSKEITITLARDTKPDTLSLSVTETLKYTGDVFTDIKPLIAQIIKDSANTIDNFKRFINRQVVQYDNIDSVYNINYHQDKNGFDISYCYELHEKLSEQNKIINLKPSKFIDNPYYTPFHLRKNRISRGYLYDEYHVEYRININLNGYQWMENNLLQQEYSNPFGKITSGYSTENGVSTYFKMELLQEQFEPSGWNDILKLRDLAFNYLDANFYLKK
ncbi:MAG: DUF3857 domain-containing protein [Flavobacteriales bacterium]|nr:DUF3857 domain-containing protein [Flavobacteriales bacterium]